MKLVNSFELSKRICDCLSDGNNDKSNEEAEIVLYNELSQISNDSFVKAALLRLCERVGELKDSKIKVYILERYNPSYKPEPEVFTDGNKALETVRGEYYDQMNKLGTSQEKSDAGYGSCGCYWNFDGNSYIGDCLIDCDYDGNRWEWRITECKIEVG